MAWVHRFKAASGIPANRFSAGVGWGGPARGAGRGGPARPFQPGNATRVSFHTSQGVPAKVEKRRVLNAEKEARIEQLIQILGHIALNAPNSATRVTASVAALNRLDGLPVAKSKKRNAGPSLEKLIQAAQAPKSGVS